MSRLYKLILLLLIISFNVKAQDYRILANESIPTTKKTQLSLNLKNTTISIEESTDGKIHYYYKMEFEGYTRKQIQNTLNKVSIKTARSKNLVSIAINSNQVMQLVNFSVNGTNKLFLKPQKIKEIKAYSVDSILRTSKDSLIKIIKRNRNVDPLKSLNKFTLFKGNDRNNFYNEISKRNLDIMKNKITIKVPPFIKLDINAENSNIYFKDKIQNITSIEQKKGTLKAIELRNPLNTMTLDNVLSFDVEIITGGNYNFKSVYHSNIASISNAKIKSEFSKIKLGEIGKEIEITDFNSEYWFYNFSENFKEFKIHAEYSKINLFFPKSGFDLHTYGSNTAHYYNPKQIDARLIDNSNNNSDVSSTMLEINDFGITENKISIGIENGIIRLGEKFIKIKDI